MFNYIKSDKYLLYICYVIFIILLLQPSFVKCQEKFLLTEEEMPGYELKRQSISAFLIGDDDQTHDAIRQKWHRIGYDDRQNVYIKYCEFDNEIEAIKGIAYASHSNAAMYIWGSFTGSIVGDGSWVSPGGGAVYFVRGNVGIKIFKPVDLKDEDRQMLISITDQLVTKIESNLSPNILFFENRARQKRINANSYQAMVGPVNHSELMNGYSLHSTWDSKWLSDANNLSMGIRKEWKDADGSVIGIDICRFENMLYASNISEIMNRKTYFLNSKYELDDPGALGEIIDNYQYYGFNGNISVVGFKNNVAVHVYQYHPTGIDTERFKDIVISLGGDILNF